MRATAVRRLPSRHGREIGGSSKRRGEQHDDSQKVLEDFGGCGGSGRPPAVRRPRAGGGQERGHPDRRPVRRPAARWTRTSRAIWQGRATTQAIHDTLFDVDANGQLVPGLVESWEWKDDRTVVLTTRSGVKFHDGTDFDAEVVRYNLERIRNPDTGSIRGGEISALDTIEVLDAKTVKLRLKQPFAAFLFPLVDVAGCVASPAALEAVGSGVWPSSVGDRPVQARRVPQGRAHDTGAQRRLLDGGQAASRPPRAPAHPGRQHPPRRASLGRRAVCRIPAVAGHQAAAREQRNRRLGKSRLPLGMVRIQRARGIRGGAARSCARHSSGRSTAKRCTTWPSSGPARLATMESCPALRSTIRDYRPYERDLDKARRLVDESGLDQPSNCSDRSPPIRSSSAPR